MNALDAGSFAKDVERTVLHTPQQLSEILQSPQNRKSNRESFAVTGVTGVSVFRNALVRKVCWVSQEETPRDRKVQGKKGAMTTQYKSHYLSALSPSRDWRNAARALQNSLRLAFMCMNGGWGWGWGGLLTPQWYQPPVVFTDLTSSY